MGGIFPPAMIVAAQGAERKSKVPASVSLAQWADESEWGARNMGTANNCFGLKPWKPGQPFVTLPTHEEIDGRLQQVESRFCRFDSIADCFEAHGEFLADNKRYAPAFETADGIAFAEAIAKAGYATDPNYADKITSIIRRYGLMQFDQPRISAAPPVRSPGPIATGEPSSAPQPTLWAWILALFGFRSGL